MTIGFRVRNAKSEIQIAESTNNYVYVQGGTITSSGAGGYRDTVVFDYATEYPPIVLIRPSANGTAVFIESIDTTSGKYTGVRFVCSGAGLDYRYRIFFNKASMSISSKENTYGMRLRNKRGELIYDSWNSTFAIVDSTTLTLPTGGSGGDSGAYTHSSFTEPWYLICPQFVANERAATETPGIVVWAFWTAGIKRVSATSCSVSWVVKWLGADVGGPSGFTAQGTVVNVILCTVPDNIQITA